MKNFTSDRGEGLQHHARRNRLTTTINIAMASHVMIVRRGGLKSRTASPNIRPSCNAAGWLFTATIITRLQPITVAIHKGPMTLDLLRERYLKGTK